MSPRVEHEKGHTDRRTLIAEKTADKGAKVYTTTVLEEVATKRNLLGLTELTTVRKTGLVEMAYNLPTRGLRHLISSPPPFLQSSNVSA
jgi:hypothetical protein